MNNLKAHSLKEFLCCDAHLGAEFGDVCVTRFVFNRVEQTLSDSLALPGVMTVKEVYLSVREQFGKSDNCAILFGDERQSSLQTCIPSVRVMDWRSPTLTLLAGIVAAVY